MFEDIILQILFEPWKGLLLLFACAFVSFYIGMFVQTLISNKESKKMLIEYDKEVTSFYQKQLEELEELLRRLENETEDKTS